MNVIVDRFYGDLTEDDINVADMLATLLKPLIPYAVFVIDNSGDDARFGYSIGEFIPENGTDMTLCKIHWGSRTKYIHTYLAKEVIRKCQDDLRNFDESKGRFTIKDISELASVSKVLAEENKQRILQAIAWHLDDDKYYKVI